jgi:hypothetical protein
MGAIVIRTRFDEGTESAEVATSVPVTSLHVRAASGQVTSSDVTSGSSFSLLPKCDLNRADILPTCMRGDTEKVKKTFPLNLYRQIQGLFCVM